MRLRLAKLDDIIAEKESNEEHSLDRNMVRAVFYCLNFGGDIGEDFDCGMFCECFGWLTFEQLETALQAVSEQFLQYEITENISQYIQKVYDYLNGEDL